MTTDEARRLFEEHGGAILIEKVDEKPVYIKWDGDYAAITKEMVPYVQAAIDRKEWPWPMQWLVYDAASYREVWYVKKLSLEEQGMCSCGRELSVYRSCKVCDNDD